MPLGKDIHLFQMPAVAALGLACLIAVPLPARANECAATAADLMAQAEAATVEAGAQAELKFVIKRAVRTNSLGDEMGCLSQLAEVRQKISTR
jgi:hypothetical protein